MPLIEEKAGGVLLLVGILRGDSGDGLTILGDPESGLARVGVAEGIQ